MKNALVLGICLALGACAAARYGDVPSAEINQPDTYRFKVYVNAFTGEGYAWEKLQPDVEAYKVANGFTSYTIVNRFYSPMGYFEYSVKFTR